jgi:hypothetical protein
VCACLVDHGIGTSLLRDILLQACVSARVTCGVKIHWGQRVTVDKLCIVGEINGVVSPIRK